MSKAMTKKQYRTKRKKAGLSQRGLANLLDIHHLTVSKRERGVSPIFREAEYALKYLVEGGKTGVR